MRMTKPMRSRLTELFWKKMVSLLADEECPVSTWREYLESVGCRRVATARAPKGFVLVDDPIWQGNKIQIPRDMADKALVMEWLP